MQIAVFNNLRSALNLQKKILERARHPSSPDNLELVPIFKFTNQEKWWLSYDALLENAGQAKELVREESLNLIIVNVENETVLKRDGYILDLDGKDQTKLKQAKNNEVSRVTIDDFNKGKPNKDPDLKPITLTTFPIDDMVLALSLRKITETSEKIIRVSRSNDQAQTDVLFDSQNTISLLSPTTDGVNLGDWLKNNSATVVRWYDQSNKQAHAVNTNVPTQPLIARNGVLTLGQTRPAILFTGNNQTLNVLKNLQGLDKVFTFIAVLRVAPFLEVNSLFDSRTQAPNYYGVNYYSYPVNRSALSWNVEDGQSVADFGIRDPINITKIIVGTASLNSQAEFKTNLSNVFVAQFDPKLKGAPVKVDAPFRIGGHVDNPNHSFNGHLSEFFIIDGKIKNRQRDDYIDNVMAYYNIN